ncbi:MAG: hypothetical protein WCF57_24370 [Pyrinomonadaceae bacterium]
MDQPQHPSLTADDSLREIWAQLGPSLRASAVSLLAQMAYNYIVAKREFSLEQNNYEAGINDEQNST